MLPGSVYADSSAVRGAPNARMGESGDVGFYAFTLKPYSHAIFSVQPDDRLSLSVRQSAQDDGKLSSIGEATLHPGLDAKLLLSREGEHRPTVAVGLQSALGHGQTGGEYIALSKCFANVDVSAGLGWGAFAGPVSIDNPLRIFSNHFDQERDIHSASHSTHDWFTGSSVGLFSNVTYHLPWEKTFISAGFGAENNYVSGQPDGLDESWFLTAGAPVAKGLDVLGGIWGGNRFGVSLTYKTNMKEIRPPRITHSDYNPYYTYVADGTEQTIDLPLLAAPSVPAQIRLVRQDAEAFNEGTIRVMPHYAGLRGPTLSFSNGVLTRADDSRGSAEEVWQGTTLNDAARPWDTSALLPYRLSFVLDTHASLSEEDQGIAWRSDLIVEGISALFNAFIVGGNVRFGLSDNLDQLILYRQPVDKPVRSDVDVYAQDRIALTRAFITVPRTIRPDLHVALSGGYLEEMFAGGGGEVLWRPHDKRYAFGVEGWMVKKRDPYEISAWRLKDDMIFTGHVNAWYAPPFLNENTTLFARAGRFLGEDLGGTLGIRHDFINGSRVEAFVTATDHADTNAYGGETHLYNGLKLVLPLGDVDVLPKTSRAEVTFAPLGRDSGQALNKPFSLYEETTRFTLPHLVNHWGEIVN